MSHVLDVTVITTTHPDYMPMIGRCMESVFRQAPTEAKVHRISNDLQRSGDPVWQINEMLAGVNTEWVAQIAGDDQWLTCHLDELRLLSEQNPKAHVCYTAGAIQGGRVPIINHPLTAENAHQLEEFNWIPATGLIRTSVLREMGGWEEHQAGGMEDWVLWKKILAAYGPEAFSYSSTPTWVYHFHGKNKSIARASKELEAQGGE